MSFRPLLCLSKAPAFCNFADCAEELSKAEAAPLSLPIRIHLDPPVASATARFASSSSSFFFFMLEPAGAVGGTKLCGIAPRSALTGAPR